MIWPQLSSPAKVWKKNLKKSQKSLFFLHEIKKNKEEKLAEKMLFPLVFPIKEITLQLELSSPPAQTPNSPDLFIFCVCLNDIFD